MDRLAFCSLDSRNSAAMLDQLIAKFKGRQYDLETSGQAQKCASVAERLGLSAEDVVNAFEAFAITKYAENLCRSAERQKLLLTMRGAQGRGNWGSQH